MNETLGEISGVQNSAFQVSFMQLIYNKFILRLTLAFGLTTFTKMHYLFGVRWIEKELKEREAKAEHRVKEA